jgi:hypothetical protein
MYAPGQEGNAGKINGLYIFYSVLNKLFRKTIYPRDEDPTNISQFAKNLLTNMRDGAPPLSAMDFVWEEIKGIFKNPQKTCGFVPYLMFMIEDVTSRSFPKEGKHIPLRPKPTKKSLIPPTQVSSSPRVDPTPQQQQNQSDQLAILVRPVGMNKVVFWIATRKVFLSHQEVIWAPIWHVSLPPCCRDKVA